MTNSELISVVIPTHNGEPHIRQCVNSVLSQSYQRIELVVADQCSSDGTLEFLKSLKDPRLRIFSNTHNGIASNWNFVSQIATGDYIMLLCDDDFLKSDTIEILARALKTNDEVDAAIARRIVVDENGRSRLIANRMKSYSGKQSADRIFLKCFRLGTNLLGEPGSILWRRKAFQDLVPWNDAKPYLLDMESYSRSLSGRLVYFESSALFYFRIHGDSLTSKLQKSHSSQFRRFVHEYYADRRTDIPLSVKLCLPIMSRLQAMMRFLAIRYICHIPPIIKFKGRRVSEVD